jgi:hypothetical protein
MPKEICQTEKTFEAASWPCLTCSRREQCPIFNLHHQLQRAEVSKPTNKRSIISACTGYVQHGDRRRSELDIGESLAEVGVSNLCDGCGERADRGCDESAALDDLKAMAAATYGIDVLFTMICCSTKRRLTLLPG